MLTLLKKIPKIQEIIMTGGVRGGGALLELAFSILISKLLGLDSAGSFFVALTVCLVVIALARSGLDIAVVRRLATARELGENQLLSELVSSGTIRVFIYGLLGSCIIFVSSLTPMVRGALGNEATLSLRWLSLSIPFAALTYYFSECYKGLERIQLSQFFYGWSIYGIALICILFYKELEIIQLSIIFVFSSISASFASGIFLLRIVGLPDSLLTSARINLDTNSFSLFCIRPITLIANWAPIWILNALSGPEAAGAYAIANRIAASLLLISIAVEAGAAPKFARHAARNTLENASRELKTAALTSGALSTLAALPLIFLYKYILNFMGESFAETAYIPGLILIIAYIINGFLAPIGTFALMVGRTHLTLATTIVSVIIVSAVVFLLYGPLGAISAALGILLMFTIRGVIYIYYLFIKHYHS